MINGDVKEFIDGLYYDDVLEWINKFKKKGG